MSNIEYKKGYSLVQASKELGVNRRTFEKWRNKGFLSVTKFPSGRYFVSEEELERLKGILSGRQNSS